MKVEIEAEIPKGFEPTGEYRTVESGDLFLAFSGEVGFWNPTIRSDSRFILLRRTWYWPEWLTCEWLAMDSDGGWYGYDEEPILYGCDKTWGAESFCEVRFDFLACDAPPCDDWKKSKMRNPHNER